MKRTWVVMNKLVYLGLLVLQISKIIMCEFNTVVLFNVVLLLNTKI